MSFSGIIEGYACDQCQQPGAEPVDARREMFLCAACRHDTPPSTPSRLQTILRRLWPGRRA